MFYVQNMLIYIYEFWGGTGGTYMVHHTFFVYYSKNGRSKRAWHILKGIVLDEISRFFVLSIVIDSDRGHC